MNLIPIYGMISSTGESAMTDEWNETFVEQKVTYILEHEGQVIIIENVPARVDYQTGERYFSPETVEHLQQMIWQPKKPARMVKTPVYEYAA
jgi:YgiT-type zinc finger domain-containing protein